MTTRNATERRYLAPAWQARAMAEGRVSLLVVPFRRQPDHEWWPVSYGELHKMRDGSFVMGRDGMPIVVGWGACDDSGEYGCLCPYPPGSRLWVAEAWAAHKCHDANNAINRFGDPDDLRVYRVDGWSNGPAHMRGRWRMSTHMPRWASRHTYAVTGVRAVRVRELDGADMIKTGAITAASLFEYDMDTAHEKTEQFKARWTAQHGTRCPWHSAWAWALDVEEV